MKQQKHEPAKEALREAFIAYQAAVLAEHYAREALAAAKAAPKTATHEDSARESTAHAELLRAIGTRCGAVVRLNEAIVARGGAEK